jgi:Holliday junction resolvase RusA-like endonuclease
MDQLPDSGELEFRLPLAPVSLQAARDKKDLLTDAIHALTRPIQFLITGDVSFELEWLIHEAERYETDRAPDVDNILKPVVDACCGPEGILIDDCQVQSVAAHWIDWNVRGKEELRIRVRSLDPEAWKPKAGLVFVNMGQALYYPLRGDVAPESREVIVQAMVRMVRARDELLAAGTDYAAARSVMSIQRLFHRSRIGRFPIVEVEDVLGNGHS